MPPRHSRFMRFTTYETGTLHQAARDISKKANVLINGAVPDGIERTLFELATADLWDKGWTLRPGAAHE